MTRWFVFLLVLGLVALGSQPAGMMLYGWRHGFYVGLGLHYALQDWQASGKAIVAPAAPVAVALQPLGKVSRLAEVHNPRLSEASGLAISSRDEQVLFAVNDSGHAPELFAFNRRGETLGSWPVAGADNIDWEDLAAFRLDGEDYLLIADAGDNFRWRPTVTLYVVKTPNLDDVVPAASVAVAWRIDFRFGGGPRDVEAVGVDVASRSIYVVSKRTVPAEVYRLPLLPTGKAGPLMAEPIALLEQIPRPTRKDQKQDPVYGQNRSQATALTMAANRAVILSYKDAWLFSKAEAEDWAAGFARPPSRIVFAGVNQQEAAALSSDGRQLLVTGERAPAGGVMGLLQIELADEPQSDTAAGP
jgi:hypothetical protein